MLSFCKFLDKHFLSALHSASRGVETSQGGIAPLLRYFYVHSFLDVLFR